MFGAIALQVYKDQQKQIENQLASSGGAVATESEFVRSQAWSKVQDVRNAGDRANEQTYDALSGPLGDLAKSASDAAAAYPKLTAGAYAAATALGPWPLALASTGWGRRFSAFGVVAVIAPARGSLARLPLLEALEAVEAVSVLVGSV
ncbi:hypothetical protein HED54_15970 [Ochrobactrum anthropi ATCC 49188]|nr:hypothetical protein [Brucella anthropi ATCC 49188]